MLVFTRKGLGAPRGFSWPRSHADTMVGPAQHQPSGVGAGVRTVPQWSCPGHSLCPPPGAGTLRGDGESPRSHLHSPSSSTASSPDTSSPSRTVGGSRGHRVRL